MTQELRPQQSNLKLINLIYCTTPHLHNHMQISVQSLHPIENYFSLHYQLSTLVVRYKRNTFCYQNEHVINYLLFGGQSHKN